MAKNVKDRGDRPKRGPGRPPLSGRAKGLVLQVRLTEVEYAALRQAAGDEAISTWVRALALAAARR